MKTKSQILNWLKNKPFELNFYRNSANTTLSFDRYFIALAFTWSSTSEGDKYWANINNEYCKWYNSFPSLNEFPFTEEYAVVHTSPRRTSNKLDTLNKLYIIRDSIAGNNPKHLIRYFNGEIKVVSSTYVSGSLSFSLLETAKDFLNTYSKELEEVKEYL